MAGAPGPRPPGRRHPAPGRGRDPPRRRLGRRRLDVGEDQVAALPRQPLADRLEVGAGHGVVEVRRGAPGVAVLAANAGLRSCALNVFINAKSIKDRDFAEKQLAEVNALLGKAAAETEAVYQTVKDKIGG